LPSVFFLFYPSIADASFAAFDERVNERMLFWQFSVWGQTVMVLNPVPEVPSDLVGQKTHPFEDLSIQPRRNLRARPLEPCRKRLPLILAVFCTVQVLLSL
jgi:hypothetical protein